MTQAVSPSPDSSSATPKPAGSAKKGIKQKLRIIIPIAVLLAAVGFGLQYWLTRPDDSIIQLSGRIESYESDLGAKVGGKVESVAVREGDRVTKGQIVPTLDDAELQAQLAAAKAQVASAEQQIAQADLQVDVVASQVEEAQLTLELARTDRDRFSTLVSQGAISQQQFDQTQSQFETAQSVLAARQAAINAAQQQVSAAQGALTQAQTSEINPGIRAAQVTRSQKQQAQAQSQKSAAQSALESAKAEQERIQAQVDDLSIISPIDGVVLARTVEPGEVISSGTTVLSVVNLSDVYLRGYIPEGRVGAISIGQPAQVFLDSAPETALAAEVSAIDTEASFTPENIYFPEDRVTQVFGLKLSIENPSGFAKPGMPANGQILLETEEPVE